jgi:hypothetical protein
MDQIAAAPTRRLGQRDSGQLASMARPILRLDLAALVILAAATTIVQVRSFDAR